MLYKTNLKILFVIVLFSVFCFVFLLTKIMLGDIDSEQSQEQVVVFYPESVYYRTVEFGSAAENQAKQQPKQNQLSQKNLKVFYDTGTLCDDSRQCLGFCEVFSRNETKGFCSEVSGVNKDNGCFYYLLDGKAKVNCY